MGWSAVLLPVWAHDSGAGVGALGLVFAVWGGASMVGSLVAADVVLEQAPDISADAAAFKREILQICADTLAPHKVPAMIRFVPTLEFAAAGKLARHA